MQSAMSPNSHSSLASAHIYNHVGPGCVAARRSPLRLFRLVAVMPSQAYLTLFPRLPCCPSHPYAGGGGGGYQLGGCVCTGGGCQPPP